MGEHKRLEMYAVIGDIWRDYDRRTKTNGVNNMGVRVRRETIWLPKTNTDPNSRMENFGGETFSRVLTKVEVSDLRHLGQSQGTHSTRRSVKNNASEWNGVLVLNPIDGDWKPLTRAEAMRWLPRNATIFVERDPAKSMRTFLDAWRVSTGK